MTVDSHDVQYQKYIDGIEILGEILHIVARNTGYDDSGDGINKTKLNYKARLPYAELKEYLSVLVRNGLVDCIYNNNSKDKDDDSTYKITKRGMDFLILYNRLEKYISD